MLADILYLRLIFELILGSERVHFVVSTSLTLRSLRYPSLRLDRDGWSLQDCLVEGLQSIEVVMILLAPRLPREVHVRHLARDDRHLILEFRVQEVRLHSTLGDGVNFHRQSCVRGKNDGSIIRSDNFVR